MEPGKEPWKCVYFGENNRLRIIEAEGSVEIVQELKQDTGEWMKLTGVAIPENQVGDVCANLARSYDRIQDERSARAKRA